jgi:hypothetical protein
VFAGDQVWSLKELEPFFKSFFFRRPKAWVVIFVPEYERLCRSERLALNKRFFHSSPSLDLGPLHSLDSVREAEFERRSKQLTNIVAAVRIFICS